MSSIRKFTHQELCSIGVRWLKRHSNGVGCQFAVSEIQTSFERTEQADVFGYRCTGNLQGSWLIEVKTSRSDFLSDFKKPHRIDPSLGVGQYRVYMCPENIIKYDELPEGWGLVTVNARGHVNSDWKHQTSLRSFDERNQDGEAYLMARLISRFDDVEKYNNMLKEASAMSSRAWSQVEKLRKEKESMLKNNVMNKELVMIACEKLSMDVKQLEDEYNQLTLANKEQANG